MSVNYYSALTYPVSSKDSRQKLLRGGVILFIPIIGQIIFAGYGIRIIKAVVNGDDRNLPEWLPGDDFRTGLAIAIPFILYSLPEAYLMRNDAEKWIQYSVDAFFFSLFCLAVVRYAVKGDYFSFFQIFRNLGILIWNVHKVILPFVFLAVGYIVTKALVFGVTLTLIFACLGLVPLGYYFMVFGYTLGKLAPRLDINPQFDAIWDTRLSPGKSNASFQDTSTNTPQLEANASTKKENKRKLTTDEMIATTHPMGNSQMFVDTLVNPACYKIQIPKNVKYDPNRALALTKNLFLSAHELVFALVADSDGVSWQIWDLRNNLDREYLATAVVEVYPEALVSWGPLEIPEFTGEFYRATAYYQQDHSFLEPMLSHETFVKHDPLTILGQTMSWLPEGQRLTFVIATTSALEQEAYEKAAREITVSAIDPMPDVSGVGEFIGSSMGIGISVLMDPRAPKFEGSIQKFYEHRLTHGEFLNCFAICQYDVPADQSGTKYASVERNIRQFYYRNGLFSNADYFDNNRKITNEYSNRMTAIPNILGQWMAGKEPRKQRDLKAVLAIEEITAYWHLPHEAFANVQVDWLEDSPIDESFLQNIEGVLIGDSVVSKAKHPIKIHPKDRETHMYIIGKTGTGKSTLLHNCIHHDIQKGKGVGVLDPHGKLVRDILRLSIPDDRIDDVIVLDIRNFEYPPPLNPLQAPGRDENYAAGEVVSILETIEGSLPPRIANSLNAAFVTIRKESNPTVRDVVKLFRDSEYRYRFISEVEDPITQDYWEDYEELSPGRQDELRGPIMHRMGRFYRNPILYPILCHPQPLNFQDLIRDKKIVLMSLGIDEAQVPETERRLVGVSLVKQFQMAAMSSLVEKEFFLSIDEVQNFITAPLNVILEQARKFGLRLTIANQYLGQLGKILPSVMGNIGTSIVFQVGQDDARKLEKYFEPTFEAGDLSDMDKFHAAVKTRYLNNSKPAFKIATRPEPKDLFEYDLESEEAAEREQVIRERSIANYTPMTRDEVLTWLKERYPPKRFNVPKPDGEDIDWQVKGDQDAR